MKYYVYILKSEKTNRYYVGQTNSIEKRLERHNNGLVKSTKSYLPWKLCYFEVFPSRSEAILREREIKAKKSKKYIEFLISKC